MKILMKTILMLLGTGLHLLSADSHAANWSESGDAGELYTTAQWTIGSGQLDSITGLSDGSIADKDVFAIYIQSGGGFSAAANTNDDSKLYLFNSSGLGILGDDDSSNGFNTTDAVLPFGHPALATLPAGLYFIAITDFNIIPTSSGGAIFPSGDLVGPTGPGGGFPQIGWTIDPHIESWEFSISLTGAKFAIPEPPGICLGMLMIAIYSRRKAKRHTNLID